MQKISHLVLADHAEASVRQASERYAKSPQRFGAKFIVADCFERGLLDYLPPEIEFDLVSCQFSLHYSFETETRAAALLENVAERLRPGGHFIATIPNANWIVKNLRHAPGLSFGNTHFSVTVDQKESLKPFGARYVFWLEDCVEHVPEFLVQLDVLRNLAGKFGLEMVLERTFHEFFNDCVSDPRQGAANVNLLFKLDCLQPDSGSLSADEWQAAGVYMAIAFRKRGQPQQPLPRRGVSAATRGPSPIIFVPALARRAAYTPNPPAPPAAASDEPVWDDTPLPPTPPASPPRANLPAWATAGRPAAAVAADRQAQPPMSHNATGNNNSNNDGHSSGQPFDRRNDYSSWQTFQPPSSSTSFYAPSYDRR